MHLIRTILSLIIIFYTQCCCGEEWVRATAPDYNELEKHQPSLVHQDPQFIKACKEMTGYYKDPNRNPALKNTIVIVGVNNGYKDFFHNFKCYMDRLGIKFLPVAMDEGVYSYLISNKVRYGVFVIVYQTLPTQYLLMGCVCPSPDKPLLP